MQGARGRRSGGLRGGGGGWRVGVGERRVSWDWPGRAATHSTAGREWLPGCWDRPGRTRVCSEGDGTRGQRPSGRWLGLLHGSFLLSRPDMAAAGVPSARHARRPSPRALCPRPTLQLAGARPVPGRALDLKGTRAPADVLTPSSPSSPGRDRAWSPGIRKQVLLMAASHHGMPTCPSPAATRVLSLRPSLRGKKTRRKVKQI